MPFDFDSENQPTVPGILQEQEEAVEEFLAEEEELDSQLSEAERRLAKAQYYHALLNQEIFEGDTSESAQAITEEIRIFIRGRLAILLGITAEATPQKPTKPVFEEDETQILRQLARKLLKKPQLMEPQGPPMLKKAEPPPTPTVKKAQPRPAPTSVPGPGLKRSEAQARIKAGKEQARKPPPKAKSTQETLTVDGTVYQKFVDPRQGDIYLDAEGKRYRIGINADGKNFMQSLTVQARAVGGIKPLPPLTGDQITMVSQRQAAEVAGKLDKVHSALIQTAITTPAKE